MELPRASDASARRCAAFWAVALVAALTPAEALCSCAEDLAALGNLLAAPDASQLPPQHLRSVASDIERTAESCGELPRSAAEWLVWAGLARMWTDTDNYARATEDFELALCINPDCSLPEAWSHHQYEALFSEARVANEDRSGRVDIVVEGLKSGEVARAVADGERLAEVTQGEGAGLVLSVRVCVDRKPRLVVVADGYKEERIAPDELNELEPGHIALVVQTLVADGGPPPEPPSITLVALDPSTDRHGATQYAAQLDVAGDGQLCVSLASQGVRWSLGCIDSGGQIARTIRSPDPLHDTDVSVSFVVRSQAAGGLEVQTESRVLHFPRERRQPRLNTVSFPCLVLAAVCGAAALQAQVLGNAAYDDYKASRSYDRLDELWGRVAHQQASRKTMLQAGAVFLTPALVTMFVDLGLPGVGGPEPSPVWISASDSGGTSLGVDVAALARAIGGGR